MLKLLRTSANVQRFLITTVQQKQIISRTFLSQAYYCNEVWDQRLNNPILQKVNLEEFYYDLEQKYQKSSSISAIDVDIFVNSIKEDGYSDELLDVVHKLRTSTDACNILNSTPHAVVRYLTKFGKHDELLSVLDDRLNYGLFLDHYTAALLLDIYWKNKDYLSGTKVAVQLLLQEDFNHPISSTLSLLHCYKYLQNPVEWPKLEMPEEPEEEVKIRVKFLRNPYDDEHFDIKDPMKIIGKTIMYLTKNSNNIIDKSFHILGLILFDKPEKANELMANIKEPLCKEIIDLLIDDKKIEVPTQSLDVEKELQQRVQKAEREIAEKDISKQCELFNNWENERAAALDKQMEKLDQIRRLANIDELEKDLKQKEQKLWYFDNEEQIELDIEAKKIYYPKRWFGKKKAPRKIDVDYVPPEINAKKQHN